MGRAIGGSLPMAVGIAINPLPIIALILILNTKRARRNGLIFVLGWLLGLAIVGGILLAVGDSANANEAGSPATWVSWAKVFLGLFLLLVSLRQFRGRRLQDEEPAEPKWVGRIETMDTEMAFGLAVVLAGLNPKNLLLIAGAAAVIAETGISGSQQAVAYLVFALIATLGLFVPMVIYLTMGDRSPKVLHGLKDWMSRNRAVIVSAICLIIGVTLIGNAIGALTS